MSLISSSPSDRTVLVVDDEAELREAIVEILLGDQISAVGAASGQEALRLIEQRPIALILLDLMMPEMDGRQVVDELRRRGHDIPVVLVSASRDLRRVALELGLAAITKPFDLDDLLRVVREGLAEAA